MSTLLPTDENDRPIPALRLRPGGAHSIAATATSARNTSGFNAETRIVSVFTTVGVFLRFGANTVTAAATDHYFPPNTYYDFAVGGGDFPQFTHLAVLRADAADGIVYISEKM